LVVSTFLFCRLAHAQGSVPLVTVATDQSSLNLSNQFGVPAGTAVNQAGEFTFVGSGGSALFLRAAGAAGARRLLQIEDEAPGFAGSEILGFSPVLGINSSHVLLLGISLRAADGRFQSALLTYNGASYRTLVKTGDVAPGSGGSTFGLLLTPGSINDAGDINFSAVPIGKSASTLYIIPFGGAPVRIVAFDDIPPASLHVVCSAGHSGERLLAGNPGRGGDSYWFRFPASAAKCEGADVGGDLGRPIHRKQRWRVFVGPYGRFWRLQPSNERQQLLQHWTPTRWFPKRRWRGCLYGPVELRNRCDLRRAGWRIVADRSHNVRRSSTGQRRWHARLTCSGRDK
jgi:hypothetical protein